MPEEAAEAAARDRTAGGEGDYANARPGSYPEFYPDIPGSIVELRDGIGIEHEKEFEGRRILLMGTAKDGPVRENIQVSKMDDAQHLFGKYYQNDGVPNDATLVKGFRRALNAGADNIQLMRISGQKAEREIPLKPTYDKKVREDTVTTEAEGNAETEIRLNLEEADNADNVRLGDVSVASSRGLLSAESYEVDEDNAVITIREDVTMSDAEVTVEYEEVQEFYTLVPEEDDEFEDAEEVAAGSYTTASDSEFQLPHENIIMDSETVVVELYGESEVELENTEYNLEYESGILTIYGEEFEELKEISYEYRKQEPQEQLKRVALTEKTQVVPLHHLADSSRPVVISGARTGELEEDEFSVNWRGGVVSEVEIEPGALEVDENVTVEYYWIEEKEVESGMAVESVFGGAKYNDIKIVVEDNVIEIVDEINKVVEELTPLSEEMDRYYFEEFDLVEDSVYVETEGGEQLLGENTDGQVIGAYANEEDFDPDPDEDDADYVLHAEGGYLELTEDAPAEIEGLKARYAYTEETERKYTVHTDVFNPTKTEDGELGGGSYNNINLSISEDRTVASFPVENILYNYFGEDKYPEKLIFNRVDEEGEIEEYTMEDYLLEEGPEQDFEIDYQAGEIVFDEALNYAESVECEEVAAYNVSEKIMRIHKPEDKYEVAEEPIEIRGIGSEITNLAQLVDAINNHPRNNVVMVSIDRDHKARDAMELVTPADKLRHWDEGKVETNVVYLQGGRDEIDLTYEELYDKLEEAYDVAKNAEDIDIVVPLGVYADVELLSDKKDFAQQLANFCAHTFLRNNEIQGVIGTQPLQNPRMVNVIEKIERLEELDTDYYMSDSEGNKIYDANGEIVDIGRFISIIAYDKSYEDEFLALPSIESGAPDFAGIASMLSPFNSPTNERTTNGQLAFQISNFQASRLINNKLVPARVKQGEAKILDAQTAAQPNSGWTRWFTVDIVFDTIDDLRALYDRYIGKANEYEQRSSLDSEIRRTLSEKPTIIEFDYDMIIDPTDPEMGRLVIELDLVPATELQRIKTVVSINRSMHPQQ